ncbi:hypothetical protein BDF14DRAFT_1816960 [Spinellus fusiger]|nr:hypothetical protein BDF14DRAFT_1816960 [Spinellus fusiger]
MVIRQDTMTLYVQVIDQIKIFQNRYNLDDLSISTYVFMIFRTLSDIQSPLWHKVI